MEVPVPVGTVVYEIDEDRGVVLIGDIVSRGQRLVVARGGTGGSGNARFATAERQAPRFAERGLPGEECALRLELKLIADIGIIGLPNAGKSTFLRAVSAARPAVGAHPFTTVEPSLGVAERGFSRLVLADIPGLIEGAHAGRGLGIDFLRHIERTRVLLHLLDGAAADPVADYLTVSSEVAQYSLQLAERRQLVAVNKIDLPEVRDRLPDLEARLKQQGVVRIFPISAKEAVGLLPLLEALFSMAGEIPIAPAPVRPVIRPRVRERPRVEHSGGLYVVRHGAAERAVQMLDVTNREARRELAERLRRLGVVRALEQRGISPGDRLRIGEVEWEWEG